ncbi:MAG: hypothetical protein RL318_3065, partial [Fibrobacterota bacterium]
MGSGEPELPGGGIQRAAPDRATRQEGADCREGPLARGRGPGRPQRQAAPQVQPKPGMPRATGRTEVQKQAWVQLKNKTTAP